MKVIGLVLVALGFGIIGLPYLPIHGGDSALFFMQPFIRSMFMVGGLIFVIGGIAIVALKQRFPHP